MKVTFSTLAISVAALVLTSSPGFAGGDWTEEGINNYHNSVPVPAPVPVPVNAAQWYLRGDLGYAAGASGEVTATGFPVKTYDFGSGDAQSFGFGLGVGYYLNRNFRVEVMGDWRNEDTTSRYTEGITATIVATGPAELGGGGNATDTVNFSGDFSHTTKLDSSAALFNLYYDIDTGSWFKPYIGGGVGFSVHRLRVVGDSVLNCVDIDRDNPTDPDTTETCAANAAGATNLSSRDSNSIIAYGLAATAMAGAAIELSPGIHWDTGYRFIYRGGTPSISYTTPTSSGTIEVNDRIDHEVRTGLRFDIF